MAKKVEPQVPSVINETSRPADIEWNGTYATQLVAERLDAWAVEYPEAARALIAMAKRDVQGKGTTLVGWKTWGRELVSVEV